MLAINKEYDHDMCWRSRMIMIMACVGDQINQKLWNRLVWNKRISDGCIFRKMIFGSRFSHELGGEWWQRRLQHEDMERWNVVENFDQFVREQCICFFVFPTNPMANFNVSHLEGLTLTNRMILEKNKSHCGKNCPKNWPWKARSFAFFILSQTKW